MRLLLCIAVLLLTACAGSVPNEKGLREEAVRAAQQSTRTAAQALTQVEADIGSSKQDGLLFYAPRHMKLAIDALETARKTQRDNSAELAQLEIILTAETALKRARDVQKQVLQILQPSLKFHAELVQIHSDQSLPTEFMSALNDLKDLIDDIEGGKLDSARKEQADHLQQLRQLEINTHLHQQLQRAREALNDADKLDSDENAPQSLLQAQQAIAAAEQTIKQTPRHFDAMNKAGFHAWQEAQHTLSLCQEMQQLRTQLKLDKVDGADFEKLLLAQEALLRDSYAATPLPTPRYLSPTAQHQQLTQTIKSLRDNQAISYQAPAHIDLRYPANAVVIENALPAHYSDWLGDSQINALMNSAVATPIIANAPATVQAVTAPEPKAQELTPPPPVNAEDELQKAIDDETRKHENQK